MVDYARYGQLESQMGDLDDRQRLAEALRRRPSRGPGLWSQLGGGVARGMAQRDLGKIGEERAPMQAEQAELLRQMYAEFLREQQQGMPQAMSPAAAAYQR